VFLSVVYIVVAVLILWKCADWFVEGAVGIAEKFHVPQMLVGMVLVSVATTSPELMVSLMAALKGMPEAALGNAIGSVIADASVALGLAAVVSAVPLVANPKIFKSSALVLLTVIFLSFFMTFNGTLGRLEGAILVAIYVSYTAYTYIQARKSRAQKAAEQDDTEEVEEGLAEIEEHLATMSGSKIATLFGVGFAGVILGSHLLLIGAEAIALAMGMSHVVMGLTITAIGTSTPEIATCVTAARKGQGGIGVGNIIGADILNICWVAGLSAVANPLSAAKEDIYFMFPAVLVIVCAMLIMLHRNYNLTRTNGVVLLGLALVFYILQLFVMGSGGVAASV
jgi:cation:H+ antiporter